MDLIVQQTSSLSGEIESPPSKLYTQLACAVAILAEGKSTIESPLRVKDTNVMFKAAEVLGATIKRTQEKISIWGVGKNLKPVQNVIDAKNSGTAACLLTSIATLASTSTVVNGDAQLRSRPMPEFLEALRRLGADIHSTKPDDSPPFVVFGGGINGGKLRLNEAEVRYLPALLLPAPLAKKKVEFSVPRDIGNLLLEPALDLMKAARVKVTKSRNKISIPNQPYRAFTYKVKREVIGAAPFIVAAGLLNSELKIRGVNEPSSKDTCFIQTLRSFGLRLRFSKKTLEVGGSHRLKSRRIDLSWAPELLPLIAVISCMAKGKTTIQKAESARTMKSDRISAIARELRKMQAKILEQPDGLIIQGPAKLKGCEVDGHDDYAVVSALAVAGLLADGKTVIKNGADALGTACSRFVSTFQSIGAEMSYS